MSVISNGRPERKDVTAQLERWMREVTEKKLKLQQESARKRQERAAAETAAAR